MNFRRRIVAMLVLGQVLLCAPAHGDDGDHTHASDLQVVTYDDSLEVSMERILNKESPPLEFGVYGDPVILPTGASHRVARSRLEKDECMRSLGADAHGICTDAPSTNPDDADSSDEAPEISPFILAQHALQNATISGAGLVVEPRRTWLYTGLPTLAHASSSQVDTQVELFGMAVPIRFEAEEYVFDFHSGEQPIRTRSPGSPYPDMSISSTYQHPHEQQYVTLTTTWTAHVTHPQTGQVITIVGALRTEENSPPFKVIRPRQRLIAPGEFGKPH